MAKLCYGYEILDGSSVIVTEFWQEALLTIDKGAYSEKKNVNSKQKCKKWQILAVLTVATTDNWLKLHKGEEC